MAIRPSWQGHLKLSLVACPVSLYTATSSAGEVHFHLLNPETNNRIRMVTTDPETGPVERSSLVKGFEVEKDRYIVVTDEEIRAVRLPSTKVIEVDRFVAADAIDRVYWDNPYYLAPDGKMAQEAFGVIREAMRRSGQIALGRVVLSTRERILALEPRGKGILAYSIRSAAEVRSDKEIFGAISDDEPEASMVAIAEQIITQKESPFDPSEFKDRFEEALKGLIAAKQKGQEPTASPEPEDTNVIDLMAALRASLGKTPGKAAKPAPKPAKGAAPKPAPKKKGAPAKRKAG